MRCVDCLQKPGFIACMFYAGDLFVVFGDDLPLSQQCVEVVRPLAKQFFGWRVQQVLQMTNNVVGDGFAGTEGVTGRQMGNDRHQRVEVGAGINTGRLINVFS